MPPTEQQKNTQNTANEEHTAIKESYSKTKQPSAMNGRQWRSRWHKRQAQKKKEQKAEEQKAAQAQQKQQGLQDAFDYERGLEEGTITEGPHSKTKKQPVQTGQQDYQWQGTQNINKNITDVNDTKLRDQLHDKMLHAQCSKDDLKKIYDFYKAGKWPWGIGKITQGWFKHYNFDGQNDTRTDAEKATSEKDLYAQQKAYFDTQKKNEEAKKEEKKKKEEEEKKEEEKEEQKGETLSPKQNKAYQSYLQTPQGKKYRDKLAKHLFSIGGNDALGKQLENGKNDFSKVDNIMYTMFMTGGDKQKMREYEASIRHDTKNYGSNAHKLDLSGKGLTDRKVAKGIKNFIDTDKYELGPNGYYVPKSK